MQTIKLNNEITCPVIGLGTFMLSPADAQNSTREALKMGYRLIDTAHMKVTHTLTAKVYGISGSWTMSEENTYKKRDGIWIRVE